MYFHKLEEPQFGALLQLDVQYLQECLAWHVVRSNDRPICHQDWLSIHMLTLFLAILELIVGIDPAESPHCC